jgi:cytochrome c oxidase subunit 1
VVYSGVLIAVMGWGVWSHHMFSVGLGPIADSVFGATTMLIAIPTGVKIFNWIATMWGGRLELKTPMLFAIGFIAMFILGGLSGVMHSSPPSDLQQTDTYFVVAHIHYVLVGGAIMGIFAAIYYWWPKVYGRILHDGMGKAHWFFMMLGMNLAFFPMHFIGLLGMPRRIYTYDTALGVDTMNLVATVGAFILGASFLIFIYNVFWTRKKGQPAGKNPWNGATLEWAMSSPPPVYNFSVIPQINSRLPLWTENGVNEIPDVPPEPIHVPGGTVWPILTASGILLLASGAIMHNLWVVLAAAGFTVFCIYRWSFEPFEV